MRDWGMAGGDGSMSLFGPGSWLAREMGSSSRLATTGRELELTELL